MKRVILAGTIVFCAAVAWIVLEIVRRTWFEEKGSLRHLQRIAKQINALPPEKQSDAYELTATAHSDRSLTLRYEMFDTHAADYDDAAKREVREMFRENACTKEALRELLDNGATLRLLVVDEADVPVVQTEILRWECGGVATSRSSR